MHCVAVKPADDNYNAKLTAYRACEAAKIPIPNELVEFFGDTRPDDTGVIRALDFPTEHESCRKWRDDSSEGYQVDITRLPPGTRYVRFYCSW